MRRLGVLWLLGVLLLPAAPAWSIVYCNITDVRVDVLTNGVQVTVEADGMLDYEHPTEGWSFRHEYGSQVEILFPGARSKVGKNFIDVSKFPVSYVQLSIPPRAQEGVGILMKISAMTRTEFLITRSGDRQSVIINVASPRTIERTGAAGPGEAGAARLEITTENGRSSIYAVNADVHEVFARLARELNLDVAVDDGVDRTVSAYIAEADGEGLLRGIARASGLALVRADDGTFMVSEGVVEDLATYRLTETRSFRMHNTEAGDAAQLLPTFIFPYLHQNPPQNAVVVTAQEDMLDKIEQDLKTIDVAPPQIMVEVLAVEFADTRDVEQSLGLSRQDADRDASYESGSADITYSTVGVLPADFQANLRWLRGKGRAEVKAQPRMAVLNGHHAEIFIGTTRFIEVEVSQYGQVTRRVQGVDVGVTLDIVPWTGKSREITTYIAPTVSNISEVDPDTGLPVLSSRDAKTQVRTMDGETIMIGGLTLEQEQVVEQKTKILGDIPIIGRLFRRKATQRASSELVVFVTPRILDDRGRLSPEEEADIRERFLVGGHEWHPPQDIQVQDYQNSRTGWREGN